MRQQLHDLLIKDNEDIKTQFVRYFVVSAIGLAVDFGTLVFATEVLDIHYLISSVLGFILGLAVNYWLATIWVFNKRSLDSRTKEFIIFGIIGVIGLIINTIGLWVLTDGVGLWYPLSKVFVTGFVFLWNFLARRKILFT